MCSAIQMKTNPYLWPLKRQRLLRSNAPILVGPFLGEVGLEALYWLSFLAELKKAGVAPERCIPIGRGGSAVWYGTPQGIELYAMRTLQDVRVENRIRLMKTQILKQMDWTPFDQNVIMDVARTLGLRRYHTLHPSWMYQTLAPYWTGQRGLDWLASRALYEFLPAPPLPEGLELPEKFVAVKFYIRATFPYKQPTIDLAMKTVDQLLNHSAVVVLNTGLHADEHQDLPFKPRANLTILKDLLPMTAENTLAAQSAVMARAMGFVGTYGGLAQLAQRFGRPCVTFYADWGYTMMAHKHLSDGISLRTGVPFIVHGLKEIPLLKTVLPNVVVAQPLTTAVAPFPLTLVPPVAS